MTALLKDGSVDIAAQINPHLSEQVLKTAKIVKSTSPRVIFMEIVSGIKPRLRGGLLGNKLFRQALNYAIDRDAIIKYVLLGNGIPLRSIISPLFPAYDSQSGYNYNPSKTKTLLNQIKYGSTNEKMEVIAPSGRYPMDRQVAKAVQSYFVRAGIKSSVELHENWAEYQDVLHGNTNKQEFVGLVGFGVIDFKTMLDFYFGREWGRNRFSNPELMSRIQDLDDIEDDDLRITKEREIAATILDNSYIIPLYNVINIYGVRRGVDVELRNDEIVNAGIVKDWR